jgi:hypothetical protein
LATLKKAMGGGSRKWGKSLGPRRQGPAVAVAIANESEHWVLKKKTTNLK